MSFLGFFFVDFMALDPSKNSIFPGGGQRLPLRCGGRGRPRFPRERNELTLLGDEAAASRGTPELEKRDKL